MSKKDTNDAPLHGVDYADAPDVSRWVTFIKRETSAAVTRPQDDTVMAFPHLVLREIVLLEILVIVMTLLSLYFDAPLEEIANPNHSPNPAKAPWYFLGLQELLHYFPPFVAGVVLPGLVVVALIVIPYFEINITRDSLWQGNCRQRFWGLVLVTVGITGALIPFHAWSIIVPTVLIALAISVPYLAGFRTPWIRRWGAIPLSDWIMVWFLCLAFTLTIIGVFFRGPEWKWVWPWIDGLYY